METNNFDPNLDPTLKRKNQETLEISATGYGLESVSKETEDARNEQQTKNPSNSCGGL